MFFAFTFLTVPIFCPLDGSFIQKKREGERKRKEKRGGELGREREKEGGEGGRREATEREEKKTDSHMKYKMYVCVRVFLLQNIGTGRFFGSCLLPFSLFQTEIWKVLH